MRQKGLPLGPAIAHTVRMTPQKIVVLVLWAALGLCILSSGDSLLLSVGRFAFWAMLLAHIVEFFAMRSVFEREGGSMAHHFAQTLIYGLAYWTPLRDAQRAKDTSAPS